MKTTENDSTPLHARVAALADQLSQRERDVATYMAAHPDEVVACSTGELGERVGTSDATVVRATKALGYSGYRELKRSLLRTLTRQRDLAATMEDRIGRFAEPDGHHHPARVADDTASLLGQLRDGLDASAWQAAVDTLGAARSVMAYGIGPAATIADFLALSLNRIGRSARSVDRTGFRLADDLLPLKADDAVVVFAPIRPFREITLVIEHAETLGAPVVVVTESLGMALGKEHRIVLSTPQSTTSSASEITSGLVLAQALTLTLASGNRAAAVGTLETVNDLRSKIGGAGLESPTLPTDV